ncbi:MAG: hypothetical protein ACLRZ2_05120 [Veillonella sp.]
MNTDAEILKSRNVVEPVISAIEDPEEQVKHLHTKSLLKRVSKQNHIKKLNYYK